MRNYSIVVLVTLIILISLIFVLDYGASKSILYPLPHVSLVTDLSNTPADDNDPDAIVEEVALDVPVAGDTFVDERDRRSRRRAR